MPQSRIFSAVSTQRYALFSMAYLIILKRANSIINSITWHPGSPDPSWDRIWVITPMNSSWRGECFGLKKVQRSTIGSRGSEMPISYMIIEFASFKINTRDWGGLCMWMWDRNDLSHFYHHFIHIHFYHQKIHIIHLIKFANLFQSGSITDGLNRWSEMSSGR